jgi:hypothetical protein
MLPPFIRHGHFDGEPVAPSTAARNPKSAKNARIHKPVTRFRKAQQAAESVHACELIRETYENGIEYRTIPAQVRGLTLLFGSITGGLALWFGWVMFSTILDFQKIRTFYVFLLAIVVLMVLCGMLVFLLTIRLELFRPTDEPVIFDRENRKVYLIARAMAPGWAGLFKSCPVHAYEYDWNLIDAEYQLSISTTGSTVNTWHTLLFIVRSSASDNRTIGSFNVANPILLTESTIASFWEHIRRFMEEDGPHLPPGESINYQEVPTSLWQSMGAVGPFGPNYFHWWKEHPFYSVAIHLFSPFFLPICLTWGIMNWLSYLTATKVQWPHEVESAVGPAIR